jgi:hypothetical protein
MNRSRWLAFISSGLLSLLLSVKVISDSTIAVAVDSDGRRETFDRSKFVVTTSGVHDEAARKYQILVETGGARTVMSFDMAIELLRTPTFAAFFNGILASSEYKAFFFELPPISRDLLHNDFEFVLTESPTLAHLTEGQPGAFHEHIGKLNSCKTATFENLGGDAVLVAPCQSGPLAHYGHLAQFVRSDKGRA